MSGIVLTAAVRQNLLSLQSTAALLATTQNNLATGNKVNSALDNPTEFFTAQGLDNRATDIANLLDGISNGVQILQAANTGLTSLEKLVSDAQSIASQVLQSPIGYDTKSQVTSTAILGATANNLLGNNINATVTGTAVGAASTGTLLSALTTPPTNGQALVVDGSHTISFSTTQTTVTNDGLGDFVIGIGTGATPKVSDVLNAIDSITGTPVASTVTGNALVLSTGITSPLQVSGSALAAFGFAANISQNFTPPALNGETLTVTATPPGTGGGIPTNITFGTGAGQVSTLIQLNAALAPNNLQAIIASSGAITISTTTDAASSTVGTIGGTAAATAAQPFFNLVPGAPVPNANSQAARANLVTQYNNVLAQINTTAQDASFNGINLLGGDTLKLVFDETGKSTLNIQGVSFSAVGLGLSNLFVGADFLDGNSANKVLGVLSSAQTTLRSEASALGSNLSIVQIREDFNKNLINVLQTGASNLTLADNNQEAANSQALSTRQSIAVSALALANQSQAAVLQLLR